MLYVVLEHVCVLSRFSSVQLSVDPLAVAHQVPLSAGLSRQEYRSGLPCPPPGDLPDPGTEPASLMSPVLAGRFFTNSATWEAPCITRQCFKYAVILVTIWQGDQLLLLK